MHPLYSLQTHALDLWEHAGQLALLSAEKRCGKTNLLKSLKYLVRQGDMTIHTSPAGLFHLIDAEHPTVLLDEGVPF